MRPIRRNLAIAGVGLAVLAAGGGAYAATQRQSDDRQAFLNDAAKRLQVTPQRLENALRGAALDRVDAAVKAGKLTPGQANAVKQRLRSGRGLGLGWRGGVRHGLLGGRHGKLDPAAGYLGLTRARLRAQLAAGRSLADVAKARGKSVTGLENAIEDTISARLNAAVKAGRLTSDQKQRILAGLDRRIGDLIQRRFSYRHP